MRLLFLALLCVLGCRGESSRVRALLGGDAVKTATKVTAYRIDPASQGDLHGYRQLSGPVPVDDKSRAELADVLLDDDTYLWDISKSCEFMPGVVLRYEGDGTTDILLCFSCDELSVYREAERVGSEDFDPRRADLVRVAKRLFPDLRDLE